MTSPPRVRRILVRATVLAAAIVVATGAATALAHPLGNFSVNHLDQLRFEEDRVVVDAIVDSAEIPTAQATPSIDLDGDGDISGSEFEAYGSTRCDALLAAVSLTIDGQPSPLTIESTSYEHRAGEAGLPTGRLECRLTAAADLSVPRTVRFADDFESQRVGWREIIATGSGVTLVDSPVPTSSVTEGLSSYPVELLDDPSDVRSASIAVRPGIAGAATPATVAPPTLSEPGPFSSVVDRVTDRFNDLVGREQLTLSVGMLAVSLALVLGASHALLPGHGKTVMAAYIAGRQGSARDAVIVGSTVTVTHTGGVLVLGLALSVSTTLAGESVIGWLGVVSGVLIAGLGAALLIGAVRHRPNMLDAHGHHHGHHHGPGGHTRRPDSHIHHHRPAVNIGDHFDPGGATGASPRAVLTAPAPAPAGHDHDHHHDHDHDHDHDHHHDHDHAGTSRHLVSRRGLVGMGVAGGLVPSPSALVVLLSAIALGRTAFGILLVLAYGVGMAATLTAAGLLLVVLRDRFQTRASRASGRAKALAIKWGRITPYATAALVLVVGLGLAVRGLATVS